MVRLEFNACFYMRYKKRILICRFRLTRKIYGFTIGIKVR